MKTKAKRQLIAGICLLALFVLYTLSLRIVDVRPIGPEGSCVAYAAINQAVHECFGVHMTLYDITDWAGVAVILIAPAFGVYGLLQWIKRKRIRNVDSGILALGVFYVLVFGAYAFFEIFVVNFRPILIEGVLEASYPSSTTMLAACVLPTTMMQFDRLIKNGVAKALMNIVLGACMAFMIVGRLISGVHWFTDILGGLLLSTTLLVFYAAVKNGIDSLRQTR